MLKAIETGRIIILVKLNLPTMFDTIDDSVCCDAQVHFQCHWSSSQLAMLLPDNDDIDELADYIFHCNVKNA